MCVVGGKALKADKMQTEDDEPEAGADRILRDKKLPTERRQHITPPPKKKQASFNKALPVTGKMLRSTAALLVLEQIDASRMRGDNNRYRSDSSPRGMATNERAINLFNISHVPVVSPNVGPTCSGFYIDLGTNIGVQVRKLFEPGRYPGAAMAAKFDKFFGARRGHVCAIGLERLRAQSTALATPTTPGNRHDVGRQLDVPLRVGRSWRGPGADGLRPARSRH